MNKKKLFSFFLAMVMVVTMLPTLGLVRASAADSSANVLPQLTKAPKITGAHRGSSTGTSVYAYWENSEELNDIALMNKRFSDYLAKNYGVYRSTGLHYEIQLAYSLNGGKSWVNDMERPADLSASEVASDIYVSEQDLWVELPNREIYATNLYDSMPLFNFSLDPYVDDFKERAIYLSQNMAVKIKPDDDTSADYRVDLSKKDALLIKARYVLKSDVQLNSSSATQTYASYSPWSEIYSYNSSINPTNMDIYSGGVLDAPTLVYGYSYGDDHYVYIKPDEQTREAIAQHNFVMACGMGNEIYHDSNQYYWYWYVDIKVNNGAWFNISQIQDNDLIPRAIADSYMADGLREYYGIVLKPSDYIYMRIRLMDGSNVVYSLLDTSEGNDGRGSYNPTSKCVIRTGFSNQISFKSPVKGIYQINYDLNKGAWQPKTTQVKEFYGSSTEVIDLTTNAYKPVRYGYEFKGWYSTVTFQEGTQVTKIDTANKEFVNLYAKWYAPAENTITYVLGSESAVNNENNLEVYTPLMSNITLQAPTLAGTVFAGWYTNASYTGSPVKTIDTQGKKDITLYAKWALPEHSITYVLNSGTNASNNPTCYQSDPDGPDAVLYAPKRNGYKFGGWYYDSTLKTPLAKSGSTWLLEASIDITVYAKWSKASYTVTYVHPEAVTKYTTVTNNNATSYTYTKGFTLTAASAEGFTFDGWYSDEALTKKVTSISNTTTGNKTFYSKWTEKKVTIKFDLDGGTTSKEGAFNTITKGYWKTIKLTDVVPTKPGYTFNGWNTKLDGSGYAYKAGAYFGRHESYTLYAQFRLKFTDVKYGTWQYDVAKYAYDNKIIQGTSTTTFSPNSNLTRGQFLVMLWRMEGQPTVTFKNPYKDVVSGKFYSTAIQWAKNNGLAAGYNDGTFKPNDPVTREQFITFVYRYAKFKGYDISTKGTTYTKCSDAAQVNKVFETQIEWAYERGFIAATGKIAPKDNISRMQAATILMRFLEFYKK